VNDRGGRPPDAIGARLPATLIKPDDEQVEYVSMGDVSTITRRRRACVPARLARPETTGTPRDIMAAAHVRRPTPIGVAASRGASASIAPHGMGVWDLGGGASACRRRLPALVGMAARSQRDGLTGDVPMW
jgi:hypothetical protein